MSKATEKRLSELHGAVATVLLAQVTREEAETTFNGDGEIVETGEMVFNASPALLATAIKFLKDNSITCDVEVDTNMTSLRDTLSAKQKHSRLASATAAAQNLDTAH